MTVVGAGRAATCLARRLAAAGWTIDAVACRTLARAHERVAQTGAGHATTLAEWEPPRAPTVAIVGVPDDALPDLAASLADRTWAPEAVALHLSGATPVEVLAPLRRASVSVGGMHPAASFTDPLRDAERLDGTTFALGGDAPAVACAATIVEACGGRAVVIDDAGRAAWHAGAAHASNHLVALVDQSLELLGAAGLSRGQARAALVPLVASVVAHLSDDDPDEVLTGPVARGDVDVVRRHLEACRALPDDVSAAYRALSLRAVAIADRDGRLAPGVADALRDALAPPDA